MVVVTRQQNDVLYARMRQRFSAADTFHPLAGCLGHSGASDYLHRIVREFDGIVVNCDEDCWVSREEVVWLVDMMRQEGVAYCGMPDGGMVPHRTHGWAQMNPFFNVFDLSQIKPAYEKTGARAIDKWPAPDGRPASSWWPSPFIGEWNNDRSEPFAGFFFWLYAVVPSLPLRAEIIDDGTTVAVFARSGYRMAVHTWYARLYGRDAQQTQRIDAIWRDIPELL